jgi:mRNA interferase MazF
MIACNRGDIVLVGFVFAEETGSKVRPALVISSRAYHRARQEVIVAAITSNVRRRLFGEHLLGDWKAAGLLFPSLVTAIVRTVKRTMIDRKLGSLTKADLQAVDGELRRALGL